MPYNDYESVIYPSSITINGGTHTAGKLFGSDSGSNFTVMRGGQVTAAEYRFNGTGNSIGGSAVLLSKDAATTLSMEGTTDVLGDWSGSWAIAAFSGTAWRDELIGGGWTLDTVAINAALFDSNFEITNGGQTLSVVPEPASSAAFLGLLSFSYLVLRRR